jgi:hypothetical protein
MKGNWTKLILVIYFFLPTPFFKGDQKNLADAEKEMYNATEIFITMIPVFSKATGAYRGVVIVLSGNYTTC